MDYRDLNLLTDREEIKKIQSVRKIVEFYQVDYECAPDDLIIRVIENEDGSFTAIANYSFRGPKQSAPLNNVYTKNTSKEALQEILRGITEFNNNDYPEKVLFWEAENGTIYDGSGKEVSHDEVNERIDEYKKSS